MKSVVLFIISLLLFFCALLCCLALRGDLCVYITIVACFTTLWAVYSDNKQFVSLSFVFVFFSCMYGVVGPFPFLLGGKIESIFPSIIFQYTDVFLCAFVLSCIGFNLGSLINILLKPRVNNDNQSKCSFLKQENVGSLCVISAFLTSLFEIVNLFRAGGEKILFLGKGVYQSAVGDLSLTLPSGGTYVICGLFLGLSIASYKKGYSTNIKKILVLTALFLLPFLFVKIIMGMRGALISAFLSGIASYSFICPMKKISLTLILFLIFVFMFFHFLYVNRGIVSLLNDNPKLFVEKITDLNRYDVESSLTSGEYVCPIGNFLIFYEKYQSNFDLKLGSTYLKSLLLPIPGFLYPGEKPQQIIYEFRDEFFASWASRSRIASTGFSSILEAFINFGWLGIIVVYCFLGYVLSNIDAKKRRISNKWVVYVYSLMISSCMSFHRESLGAFVSFFIWQVILVAVISFVSKNIIVMDGNREIGNIIRQPSSLPSKKQLRKI